MILSVKLEKMTISIVSTVENDFEDVSINA